MSFREIVGAFLEFHEIKFVLVLMVGWNEFEKNVD